jgi:hypothetical protein
MRLRFILALLILLLACALQFWCLSAGIFINFILAALIAFAFLFDLWELAVFVLFAIFVINWEPSASMDILVFAVVPFLAYVFHKAFAWTLWAGLPAALICGFLLLYLFIAPAAIIGGISSFLADVVGGLLFSAAAAFILQ